ncbi:MAG: multidrug resistance efflux transporter family protein [Butyricicoccaceae bacterium]
MRFLIMLPLLALLLKLMPGDRFRPVADAVRAQPIPWFLWSTIGFGLFYLPLTLASVFGESWLVAASWQITIVAGVLLTPIFGKKIPGRNLALACLILLGILILQIPHLAGNHLGRNCLALIPIVIAAFSYPLGNRKMMQYCPQEIDTIQRVFGMTLCSMPFWLITALVAWLRAGAPSSGQVLQSAVVAIFSGIIATILFFRATDMVKHNPKQLALIEATQSGEVIFTLIGGILVLGDSVPTAIGAVGLALIIGGMVLNSLVTGK